MNTKHCYVVVRGNAPGKRIGLVKYNDGAGYYPTDYDTVHSHTIEDVKNVVRSMNELLGVSEEVQEAMEFGSMFGWHLPLAQCAHEHFGSGPDKQ